MKTEIIENSKEARDRFGHAYGSENIVLTDEQHQALKSGKVIAHCDGEYTHFISLENK